MSTLALRLGQVRWSFLLASILMPLLLQLAIVVLGHQLILRGLIAQGLQEQISRYYVPSVLTVGLVLLFASFRGRIGPFLLAAVIWLPAMYYLSIAWTFGLVISLYGGP